MKMSYMMVAVVLVLIVVGVSAYAFMNQANSTITESAIMEKSEEVSMTKADTTMIKESGQYAQFTSELLESSASTRRVLFFYANWCPTCKVADTSFNDNGAKFPSDVTLIRVNYDDTETDKAEKELAQKYGVTYQHTFVQIDDSGKEIAKWNGGEFEELISNLK